VPASLPLIETARLRLRPVSLDDVERLWKLWTDVEVRRYLLDDTAIERERASQMVRDWLQLAPQGLGLWNVEEIARSGLIGCAGLLPVSSAGEYHPPSAGGVEPLVALAPAFWQRGYASEALAALVEYAASTLRLERLVAAVDVPNAASDRLLGRLGFACVAETEGPRYRLRHYVRELRSRR
jgi:ribosomal-protein-alanine N-acetyltransferase